MTDPGALSSWNPTEGVFSLNDEVPKPRPRAWERAPKSPVLARHHGRKVWKRYEAPAKPETKDELGDVEQTRQALGDATNTPRPVKRLRLKDAPGVEDDGKENKAAQYFTTLRDKENAGTPRRKQASRKSLKPDNVGVKTRSAIKNTAKKVDAEEIAVASPPRQANDVPEDHTGFETPDAKSSEVTTTTEHATPTDERASDSGAMTRSEIFAIADADAKPDDDVASPHPASENANDLLMDSVAESAANISTPSPSRHEDETVHVEGAVTVEDWSIPSSPVIKSLGVPEALLGDTAVVYKSPVKQTPKALLRRALILEQPNLDSSSTPGATVKTPKRASPRKKSKLSPHAVATPNATLTPKLPPSTNLLPADFAGETPQIGTSLLRRESLRRKESPSKGKNVRKSKTPKKDTLQRRDTLQEREILQKVIAETTAYHGDENLDALTIDTSTLPASSSTPRAEDNVGENASSTSESVFHKEQPDVDTIEDVEAVLPAVDGTNVERDLHRAMEAIEVYEHPAIADASQPLLGVNSEDAQGMDAMDKANEVLAKTELDDVSQATEGIKEQTPNQKTRSGARFSDDTSMLKDFLNRAQARKAARKPLLSAADAPIPQNSPRRSPRKMYGSQDGQASSPEKSQNIANRPNTPPSKPRTDTFDSDDGEEHAAEPASCRRSARTRLPAPSKAVPGAPSFIPVRRADGTDPVVLQKSQAQELAVTTRANTRRNKGQSKPPLLALQDLPTETADLEMMTAKERVETAKSVAWAERLASYRDAKGEAEEAEEKRPKVRRLRGLGAANGTPAAKRTTAVVSTSNGTPAAKRRGKA